jgi:hypothetical protein
MYNILKYLSVTTESPEIVYSRTRMTDSCNYNETMTSEHGNTVMIIYTVICVLLLAMCVKGTCLGDSYEQRSAPTTRMTVAKINCWKTIAQI